MEDTRTIVPPGTFREKDQKPPSIFAWLLWVLCVALYVGGVGAWIWLH